MTKRELEIVRNNRILDEAISVTDTVESDIDGALLQLILMKQLYHSRPGRRSFTNPAEAAPILHLDYLCAFCEVGESEIIGSLRRLRSRSWMAYARIDKSRIRAQVPLFLREDGRLGLLRPGVEPDSN